MVIKIIPSGVGSTCVLDRGSQMTIYNSSQSLSSSSGEKEPRVLFLGFSEPWERDLWSGWLTEVSPRWYSNDCQSVELLNQWLICNSFRKLWSQ